MPIDPASPTGPPTTPPPHPPGSPPHPNHPAGRGRPRTGGTRWLAALVLAFALALGLASCGASTGATDVASLADGDNASTATTAKPKATKHDREEAFAAFAKCMREHGVDMPDPDTSGDGPVMIGPGAGGAPKDPEAMKKADAACKPILDEVMQNSERPNISPEDEAKMREQAVKFAQCMREHGIDMPDPTFGDNGTVSQELGGNIDPSSSTMKEAQKACGSLIGGPGGKDGPGAGGQTSQSGGGGGEQPGLVLSGPDGEGSGGDGGNP